MRKLLLLTTPLISLAVCGANKDMTMTVTVEMREDGVVQAPALAQPIGEQSAKPAEPQPPPEPSVSDASDPRRLIRYFCKMWKEERAREFPVRQLADSR